MLVSLVLRALTALLPRQTLVRSGPEGAGPQCPSLSGEGAVETHMTFTYLGGGRSWTGRMAAASQADRRQTPLLLYMERETSQGRKGVLAWGVPKSLGSLQNPQQEGTGQLLAPRRQSRGSVD